MTIDAKIYASNSMTYTRSLYQHDKNVTLVFDGIDLPSKYEVQFSNEPDGQGISVSCEGDSAGVLIPDELLSTGKYVYAWVCNTEEETGRFTVCPIVIPVIPRPVPIPVGGSSGSGKFKYEVDEDTENVTFLNALINRAMEPNIEEDN